MFHPVHRFKVGDRVLVSGTRLGTLRFLDITDFAGGLWAGVELDDPVGKNDGCVAGTRLSDQILHKLVVCTDCISAASTYVLVLAFLVFFCKPECFSSV